MAVGVIKTNNLTKRYKKFVALDNVNINVNQGDIYGLIGKNGAGKTTLFKVIMGLTDTNAGEMTIDGHDDLDKGRQEIGFMIGSAFYPYLTGKQNLEYFRKVKSIKDPGEVDRVLELVGLAGVNKPFKAYSMGMKQRLGIAGAMLGNPKIIILDEPINGLDPQGINDVRALINDVNQKLGTTFIISSHILSELDLVATKIGIIDHGRLLTEVTHKELHQLTNRALLVEVDDPERAITILNENLDLTSIEKNQEGALVITEKIDAPEAVAKVIVESGLQLYSLHKQETTLEEYFINLVGGSKDV